MNRNRSALAAAFLLWMAAASAMALEPLLKQGNARVVLVGDSITGLSRNFGTGFAHQMDWALMQAYPGCHPNIIALGGSGQTVGSWQNVEKRSRGEEVFLDVPKIEVRATLAEPADVLVIMLGMNDVLSPSVDDDEASVEAWADRYRELILSIQSRLKPGVTALGMATPCTEDLASPKNHIIQRLNARAVKLAAEMNLLVLPTREAVVDVLIKGRTLQPDFHVTYDYVHPNDPGHVAIAMAMLKGLGEEKAAQILEKKRLQPIYEKVVSNKPSVSYSVEPQPSNLKDDQQTFRVRCWCTTAAAQPASAHFTLVREGWSVTPVTADGKAGEFVVTGSPDRVVNKMQLEARSGDVLVSREITIVTPWLVCAGFPHSFWKDQFKSYDAEKAAGPMEAAIVERRDFTQLTDLKNSVPWQRFYPSVNFTGGDRPGSLDFAGVTHAKTFEGGYAARWIKSDRRRIVNLNLSSQVFAGTMRLRVCVNGEQAYDGLLTEEPKKQKSVPVQLRAGWNALVYASDHVTWQWQCSVDLEPVEGDSLDGLRYSTVYH